MMRVAMALPAFLPATAYGGPVTKVRRLALDLQELGVDVRVLTSTLANDPTQRLEAGVHEIDGLIVERFPVRARFRWSPFVRWKPISGPFDVLHVFGMWNGLSYAAIRWAQREQIPWVWETLGMLGTAGRWRTIKRMLTPYHVGLARTAAGLIVTSPRELEEAPEAFSSMPRWLRANPLPDASQATLPDRATARRELGMPTEGPIWGFLGRVAHRKGIPRLLDAWGAAAGPGVVYVAGPVEDAMLGQRVQDTPGAHLMPPVSREQVPLFLRAIDALVLVPEHGENFGNTVAEALAVGTPALISRAVGAGHWLEDHGVTVLSDPMQGLIAHFQAGRPPQGDVCLPESLRSHVVASQQASIYREVLGPAEEKESAALPRND